MLSCKNLTKRCVENIFKRADHWQLVLQNKRLLPDNFKNKILVNAFFEPSTRTSLSFESAMYRIGGKVINFSVDGSSIAKGETHEDTIKSLSNYGDVMVIRHPKKGFAKEMSEKLNIPIINGGDGDGEHPTQALLDLYTIQKRFNLEKRTRILFIGDIKHSRTIHSLIDLLMWYPRTKINIMPYKNKEPDEDFIYNICINHGQNLDDIIIRKEDCQFDSFDIIYSTRVQKERSKGSEREDIKIDNKLMKNLKSNAIIMHPFPRNTEISPEVDTDKRAVYFEQMKNGVFVRMAILDALLMGEELEFQN